MTTSIAFYPSLHADGLLLTIPSFQIIIFKQELLSKSSTELVPNYCNVQVLEIASLGELERCNSCRPPFSLRGGSKPPLNFFALSSGRSSSNVHSKQMHFTAYAKMRTLLLKVIHVFQCLFGLSTLPRFNYLHTHYINVSTGCSNLLVSTESKLYL